MSSPHNTRGVEVKPCPFCAGAMKVRNDAGWFGHEEDRLDCIIGYEQFPPADLAHWNTRAVTDEMVEAGLNALEAEIGIQNYKEDRVLVRAILDAALSKVSPLIVGGE